MRQLSTRTKIGTSGALCVAGVAGVAVGGYAKGTRQMRQDVGVVTDEALRLLAV